MDNKLGDDANFELIEQDDKYEKISEITALNRQQFIRFVKATKKMNRKSTEVENSSIVLMTLDPLLFLVSLYVGPSLEIINFFLLFIVAASTLVNLLRNSRTLVSLKFLNLILLILWLLPSKYGKDYPLNLIDPSLIGFLECTDCKFLILGIKMAIAALSSWLITKKHARRVEFERDIAEEAADYRSIPGADTDAPTNADSYSDDEDSDDEDDNAHPASDAPAFHVDITINSFADNGLLLSHWSADGPVIIYGLVPRSEAEKSEKLKPGQALLSINGVELEGSVGRANWMLQNIKGVARLEVRDNEVLLEKILEK